MELELWIGLASVQSTFSLCPLLKGLKGGIYCKVTVKEMLNSLTLEQIKGNGA